MGVLEEFALFGPLQRVPDAPAGDVGCFMHLLTEVRG